MIRAVGSERYRELSVGAVPVDEIEATLLFEALGRCVDMRRIYAATIVSLGRVNATTSEVKCIAHSEISDGEMRRFFAESFLGLYPLVSEEERSTLSSCLSVKKLKLVEQLASPALRESR